MIVESKIRHLKSLLENFRKKKLTIGFVPTMGALHSGHISLVDQSTADNNITVVSIFVNPTQFNNKTDLEKYPRDLKKDLAELSKSNVEFVFIPEIEEMYPEKDKRVFDLNGLDTVMEGKFRDGHFNGVVQIVSKLFEIVNPNKAYFGRKDFQQLAVINCMNERYLQHLNIEIIGCDIIREKDGLAKSSRNSRLSEKHRTVAPVIYKTLLKYSKHYKEFTVTDIMKKINSEINDCQYLEVEYIDIVDNKTLRTVNEIIPGKTTACIAVYAGDIRLIDNIEF